MLSFRFFLSCILSVFLTSTVFGQVQKVSFSLVFSDFDCASIPKELILSSTINQQDSILYRQQFSECSKEFEFPKMTGKYQLSIRTQLTNPILIPFSVDANSPDLIELGEFKLKEKVSEIDEVTVTGIQRSFIQVDADKTTITVKDNPILTTSSVYDAILKIPGIVPFPGGGFATNGQLASIYFEGIPSSLSTDDLTNLLKSLPATSVETIEIISNPGASYDANVSGAIINVISQAKVSNWISGTFTLNYGWNQHNKVLPSLVMSGRTKKYSWQFQSGYSYFERSTQSTYAKTYTSFNPFAELLSTRSELNTNQLYYFKPSLTYRINRKSSVILNYNGTYNSSANDGNSETVSNGISPDVDLKNSYSSTSNGLNNELILKYRNNIDTLKRVIDVTAYYSDFSSAQLRKTIQQESNNFDYSLQQYQLHLKRLYIRSDLEIPFEKFQFYLNTGLKYSKLIVYNKGQYNLQNPSSNVLDNPTYTSNIDFDYQEDNVAGYVELKKGFGKKISVGAGLRAENFSLNQRSNVSVGSTRNYFNLFPSFNSIFRFNSDMNLIATYSRKIGIPSYNQFDPNNSGYYDSYNTSSGNSGLQPNFYDNAELKFSVFDYLQLSANYSHSQSLNLNEITVEPNSLVSTQTFRTYQNVNSLSYFLAIPVPFGLFTKGLAFFDGAIDVDKINFLYLYADRTKTQITGFNYLNPNKALWTYGVYSQFVLPANIRMNIDYYVTTRGTYQIYEFTKNRSSLEVVLSKDFLKKKLKTSISIEDIFNTSQSTLQLVYPNLNIGNYSKNDTRIVWFKLAYSFGKYEKTVTENEGPPSKPNLNDGL